jgi:transposase
MLLQLVKKKIKEFSMSGVVKIEIAESAETLKELLKQAVTPKAKERIQVLYWLKTKTVETVEQIAVLLGRHRVTVQRWLSQYRQQGIEALLEEKRSPGRPCHIPVAIVKRLEEELANPEGFKSYREVQLWLKTCCDVEVAYRTVHQLVRYRLQSKLKVPRPISVKQAAGAVEEFKKNCPLN